MTQFNCEQNTFRTFMGSVFPYRNGLLWTVRFALVLLVVLFSLPSAAATKKFAAKQLSAFAQSRAGVGDVIKKGPEVYQFLIDAFTGSYTSVPLVWDPREPNDNAYAEHKPTVNRRYINIRVSSILTPLDQVACVVYESINAQNEKQFSELTDQVHGGLLTKQEFIHKILRLEHQSLKKTRAFLSDKEPYKGEDLSKHVFLYKMQGTPEDFESFLVYLRKIKRHNYDVYKHYSDFYDFILPPTKKFKMQQEKKASSQSKKKIATATVK